MTAAIKNFIIEQKATFKKRMTYKDSSRTPINLNGFTAKMQIRSSTGALLSNLSTENGKIILGAEPGTIDLLIPANETAEMSFTTPALYDFKLVYPDKTETRLIQGTITISPGQTA